MALLNYTFNDITDSKMFDLTFKKTEEFLGHTFTHIGSGVFKVSEPFEITMNELKDQLENYIDQIMVIGYHNGQGKHSWKPTDHFTAVYATNELWCNVVMEENILFQWLLENGEDNLLELTKKENYPFFHSGKNAVFYSCHDLCNSDTPFYAETQTKTAFEPIDGSKGKLGEKPFISINGARACLVEPNIYYFSEDTRYRANYRGHFNPEIDINMSFEEPCYMLGYSTDIHPTMYCGIKFFAVGEKAGKRLKEIQRSTDYFFHAFRIREQAKDSSSQDSSSAETPTLRVNWEEVDKYEKKLKNELWTNRKHEIQTMIQTGHAETLVSGTQGLDFTDITVFYKTLLYPSHNPMEYDFVYVTEDHLMLEMVQAGFDSGVIEAKILQTAIFIPSITNLTISSKIKLKNGAYYPLSIEIFDRKQEVCRNYIKDSLVESAIEINEPKTIEETKEILPDESYEIFPENENTHSSLSQEEINYLMTHN